MYKLEAYKHDVLMGAELVEEEELVYKFTTDVYHKLIEKGYVQDIDGVFYILTKIY